MLSVGARLRRVCKTKKVSLRALGQRLAHVADYDLHLGIPVERAAEDKADDVDCGLDMPTPGAPASMLVTNGSKPL